MVKSKQGMSFSKFLTVDVKAGVTAPAEMPHTVSALDRLHRTSEFLGPNSPSLIMALVYTDRYCSKNEKISFDWPGLER